METPAGAILAGSSAESAGCSVPGLSRHAQVVHGPALANLAAHGWERNERETREATPGPGGGGHRRADRGRPLVIVPSVAVITVDRAWDALARGQGETFVQAARKALRAHGRFDTTGLEAFLAAQRNAGLRFIAIVPGSGRIRVQAGQSAQPWADGELEEGRIVKLGDVVRWVAPGPPPRPPHGSGPGDRQNDGDALWRPPPHLSHLWPPDDPPSPDGTPPPPPRPPHARGAPDERGAIDGRPFRRPWRRAGPHRRPHGPPPGGPARLVLEYVPLTASAVQAEASRMRVVGVGAALARRKKSLLTDLMQASETRPGEDQNVFYSSAFLSNTP